MRIFINTLIVMSTIFVIGNAFIEWSIKVYEWRSIITPNGRIVTFFYVMWSLSAAINNRKSFEEAIKAAHLAEVISKMGKDATESK